MEESFFRLGKLGLELDAVGDVIDKDDAADSDEVSRDKRRDSDVGNADVSVWQDEAELVEGVGTVLFAHTVEAGDEVSRENRGDGLMEDVDAPLGVHALHLGVPALDAVVEVDGEDSDVDGFDDVLVELLEAFELGDLLLEAAVELRVLDRDADVAC